MANWVTGAAQTGADKTGAAGATNPDQQRLGWWRPMALIALSLVGPEDDAQRVNQDTLHRFRSPIPLASGMVPYAHKQLVLVEAEQDARRTDHNQRLVYGKTAAAAPTAGQPWMLWTKAAKWTDPDADAFQILGPQNLWQYLQVSAGQPWFMWRAPTPWVEPEDDARRSDHAALHRYRQAFQTVGQSYRIWPPRAVADQATPEDAARKPVDLTPFRGIQAAAPVAGAPWYLWVPPIARQEPEEDARRGDQTQLHRYRQAFQTVGQPWLYWVKPQQRIEEEPHHARPAVQPFRQVAATPAGQPWYLWKPAVADQTAEQDVQRAVQVLHLYRTGFQTVGQPWAYWIKPQARVDDEAYSVPGPASLYPYRQITITAQPGQPWWAWPAAKADQSTEPNPVVTDHAKALYPFRPHDATAPPPDLIGEEWIIRARRRRRS